MAILSEDFPKLSKLTKKNVQTITVTRNVLISFNKENGLLRVQLEFIMGTYH